MSSLPSPLLAAACVPVVYAALIVALILAGRGQAVRSVAGFIPDCIVLVRRLLGDPRVSRRHKQLLGALIGYLVLPLDLVPDFIPVAGQIDDAVVVAVVLRIVLRGSGAALLREHWSGPDSSLALVLRLVGRTAPSTEAVLPRHRAASSHSGSTGGYRSDTLSAAPASLGRNDDPDGDVAQDLRTGQQAGDDEQQAYLRGLHAEAPGQRAAHSGDEPGREGGRYGAPSAARR